MIGGRYEVLGTAGVGGQGRVLRVRDARTGAIRALKIGFDASARGRLQLGAEYQRLLAIACPTLPQVHDVGVLAEAEGSLPAGCPYFVADWIDGAPVRGGQGEDDVHRIARDVATALASLHARGLVHRDVSAGNVLVRADGSAALVDLGLAGAAATGPARGTLPYLAPEALAGVADERSDLYGLGAVLWHAVRGRPPLGADDLAAQVRRTLEEVPARLDELTPATADLIASLLDKEPGRRPASAQALVRSLDAIAAARGDLAPVGPSTPSWSTLSTPAPELGQVIDALARAEVTVVHGPPGAGVDLVLAEAARRGRLAALRRGEPRGPRAGTAAELAAELELGTDEAPGRLAAQVVAAARAAGTAIALLVEADAAAEALAAAVARRPSAAIVIGVEAPTAPATADVHRIELAPVPAAALAAWIEAAAGRLAPPTWLSGLVAASGGLAGVALELARLAAAAPAPFELDLARNAGELRAALARAELAAGSDARRRAAAALAIAGGEWSMTSLVAVVGAADAAAVAELAASALAARRGDALVMADAIAEVVLAMLTSAERRAVAQAAARVARADDDPLALARMARWLPAGTSRGGAARRRERRASTPALARRHRLGTRGRRAGAGASGGGLGAGRARGARRRSRRRRRRVGRARRRRRPARPGAGAAGPARRGQRVFGARARPTPPSSTRWSPPRRASPSPRASSCGRGRSPATPLHPARALAAGLAALYLDELDAAERAFAWLERQAAGEDDASSQARALALRGMVAQRRGALAVAASCYGEAADAARRAGDALAAAVADANRGTALAAVGRAADALVALGGAARALEALGALPELAAAEFNRGVALVAVGQLDDAAAAASRAIALDPGSVAAGVYAPIVLGDVARRRGEVATARAHYRAALAAAAGDEARLSAAVALGRSARPSRRTPRSRRGSTTRSTAAAPRWPAAGARWCAATRRRRCCRRWWRPPRPIARPVAPTRRGVARGGRAAGDGGRRRAGGGAAR
ncbi:MAG: serine/threonine-protein kinase [Kofleriaceae bacterium]